jgi:Ca2+-dependent lipid-binding protein
MEKKAKEAEEAAKAEIDAAREAGGEAARKEAEEHTRKAREAAERQHGLERKLRMELARLKAAGGGPVLHARIEKAQNLPKVDSVGWIDAYLVMRVGGEEHKTKIRKRERDPLWDEEFEFALEQSGGGQGTSLEVTLFDWEMMRNDRPIGSISIKVSDVVEARVEGWFELVDEVGEKVCGQDGAPSTVSMSAWYEEGSSAEAERLKKKIEDEKEAAEREEAEAEKARQEAAMAGVQMNASEEREKKSQARNLLPPYLVTCTVKGARDLPKMDSLGKCDCYVIVSCGGVEKKTNRVDKNYDPDFDESFTFDVAHQGASLSCQVFDFNRMSKDEVIGSVTVPIGKLTSAEPLEGMYKILGKSGLSIKGHSGKDSRLLLSITAQAPPSAQGRDAQYAEGGAAVAEVGSGAAAAGQDFEPFLVGVKVVEGKHMPKMDAFGKCDAYCILSTGGGGRAQTTAKKNTYSPVWGEDFELSVEHARAELVVSVYDWDLTGKDDYIGNCHVPIEQLIGGEGRGEYVILTEESDAVMGHDGEPCVIVLEACRKEIGASEQGEVVEGGDEEQDGLGEPVPLPYDVVVDLRSARHLPKMDRMGTADPYVIVSLGGQEQRTNRINGTLNPDWNEKVQLQVTSPAQSLVVTVMDWDRLSKDKVIGQARVPAGKLCPGGVNRTKLRLVSESGMPITGHDGQDSTISLRLTPASISTPEALPEGLDGARSAGIEGGGLPVAGGGGGLEGGGGGGGGSGGVARVRIVDVSHLPKMDRFGTCDPYVMLIVADPPQRHQTSVVKKTYNASWETDNVFDVALGSGEEELVVRVMDWDLVGDDELVGTAHIPSKQLLLDEADMPATRLVTLQTAKGVPVIGKDGKPTSVTLQVEVSPVHSAHVAEEGGTEDAHEEEAVHGTLHVSIISACGLPKMDTWTHKADPYLVVECRGDGQGDGGRGGVVHKTKTMKNTLSPTWNESCRFDCIAGKSRIHINMHDYNRASADEFMGLISIPVVSRPTPPTDYPLTGTLAGGETCRGTVRISTAFTPGPAPVAASLPPGDGGDSGGGGRLDMKVIVNGVRSLPKMDMTGKCDPYVVVTVGGESRETGHKKNVYEATWGEQDMDATFFFSADAASPGEIVASVFDWNRVSQPTLIGTARIRVGDLAIGVASSTEYAVCGADGEHIKGHDGGATFVGLEVLVQKAEEEDGQEGEGGSGEGGMWDVRVCVKRCEHMPKMDSLLGKCDPMVTVRLGAREQATKPLKNRYEGNWKDENFLFTTRSLEDSLLLTAWDFDTVSKNDFIGLKRMGLSQFDPRQSDDAALETEMMLELVDRQGSPVKGHDGQNSLVYVSVQVSAHKVHMGKGYIDAVTRGLDVEAVCDSLADKPWKLKVSVISGEHLPKTDTYGLCDPFVTLSIDGGDTEQKTSVIKNTLSPYWDEHFVFNPVKCSMRGEFLTLVVWDQDALGQEVVGLARIPLGAIAAAADVEWPPMSLHTKEGEPVFDARGFESTIQLKFEVDIPKEGASREIVDAAEVQREEVKSAVSRLEELCGEFEVKEGDARRWLLSSDAKLDALASMCEQVIGRIKTVEGAKEAEIEGLLERVDLVRSSLNVACHEAFSASQVQMALGIGVTVVQVALLKLFLIWG